MASASDGRRSLPSKFMGREDSPLRKKWTRKRCPPFESWVQFRACFMQPFCMQGDEMASLQKPFVRAEWSPAPRLLAVRSSSLRCERRLVFRNRRARFRGWQAACQTATFKRASDHPFFGVDAGMAERGQSAPRLMHYVVVQFHQLDPPPGKPSSSLVREAKVAEKVPQNVPLSATFSRARPRSQLSSGLTHRAECRLIAIAVDRNQPLA